MVLGLLTLAFSAHSKRPPNLSRRSCLVVCRLKSPNRASSFTIRESSAFISSRRRVRRSVCSCKFLLSGVNFWSFFSAESAFEPTDRLSFLSRSRYSSSDRIPLRSARMFCSWTAYRFNASQKCRIIPAEWERTS